VGKQVYDKAYFQYLLKNNEWFGKLNWKVLDGKTFLRVNKLYKASVLLQPAEVWLDAANLYNPPKVADPQKRIFLNRSPKTGRCLSNLEEVTPILEKYGFETIDAAGMSIDQQKELFANTRYLIAIHGAGITNMIFANTQKLSLLEILPGQMLNTHYYWMAGTFGCPYDAILGGKMNVQHQFRLDPAILEHHIQKMLK
jgi:capsular polysaccharide biosynthesis protein